jgi:hypothetical protein
MNFLRLLPVLISFLLLAAHFLRAGQTGVAFALIFLLPVLLVKKPWVPLLIQLVLFFGAVEWLLTLVSVAQMRIEFGSPWTRMAIILGSVALFTLLSGLVFWGKALSNRYSGTGNES